MNRLFEAMDAALTDAEKKHKAWLGQTQTWRDVYTQLALDILPYAMGAWRKRFDFIKAWYGSDEGLDTIVLPSRIIELARELCWDERVCTELARVEREGAER